MPENKLYLKD